MNLIPTHVIAEGHAFFVQYGVLMAAPILIDNTIEWDEFVEVSEDGDGDPATLADIRLLLGLDA